MRFLRIGFLFALITGFIGFSSCGPSNPPEPSVEEAQLKLLSKTWTVSEVRFGSANTNRTSEYTGMTLTISGDFNATANEYDYSRNVLSVISPWPKSGKWSFDANDPESLIIRKNDNLPITYSV